MRGGVGNGKARRCAAVGLLAAATLSAADPARAAAGPPVGVSAEMVRGALTCRTAPSPRAGALPVLLVHGAFAGPQESFAGGLLDRLPAAGLGACALQLPERATGPVAPTAEWVVAAIRQLSVRGGRVDVVSHGEGAVVVRWATRWWPDAAALVDDHVSLAGPVTGSTSTRTRCGSGGCAPGVAATAAGSRTLAALNRPRPLAPPVDATAITSDSDEVVQPPSSGRYPEEEEGANAASIQELCPGRVVDHNGLLFDPVSRAIVLDALVRPGGGAPGAVRTACDAPAEPGPGLQALLRDRVAESGGPGGGEAPLPAYVAERAERFGELELELVPKTLRRTRLKRTLRFVVRTGGVPLRRATVVFGKDDVTTDARGRAQLNLKPERVGRRTIKATADGYTGTRTVLRIVARRR